VVGNSSSGLIEAPSARIGTINIGSRQRGRLKAGSVIDCEPTRAAIVLAIERLYSTEFQRTLGDVINPYGTPGASRRILDTLKRTNAGQLVQKRFVDYRLEEKR
jgi:GDP/UDP-N,N'-diacetylbacillosamine 2-epimerase (hydrolysing)